MAIILTKAQVEQIKIKNAQSKSSAKQAEADKSPAGATAGENKG